MSDQISLKGIRGFGFHGVFPEEKKNGQEFLVDVLIAIDLSQASKSDDLSTTIDYGVVVDMVLAHVTGEALNLIEALAGRIAEEILQRFPLAHSVSVTVHKPFAPLSAHVSDIAVTVEATR